MGMELCCHCNPFRYNGPAHLIGLHSKSVNKISKPQLKLRLPRLDGNRLKPDFVESIVDVYLLKLMRGEQNHTA